MGQAAGFIHTGGSAVPVGEAASGKHTQPASNRSILHLDAFGPEHLENISHPLPQNLNALRANMEIINILPPRIRAGIGPKPSFSLGK